MTARLPAHVRVGLMLWCAHRCMTENILVTGGTGTLCRHVVDRLAGAGHPVRVLSRTRGPYLGDLSTGAGLQTAIDGVKTILHLAGDPRRAASDVEGTRRPVAAAPREAHLVFISIVGVDRHPYFYYRAKFQAEGVVERSGLPYTILRITRFHDLVPLALRAPPAALSAEWEHPCDSR